mmetsp:Transcript_13936/g.20844  ORF Transcript_13936/g.20844 Transcript_13936/m.20844 type:complete len:125 (-) Transcript_13936:747-1121(-)
MFIYITRLQLSKVASSKNVHMLRAMDPKWKGSLSSNTVKAHDANTRNTRDNSSHVDTIDLIPNDIPLSRTSKCGISSKANEEIRRIRTSRNQSPTLFRANITLQEAIMISIIPDRRRNNITPTF